MGNIEYLTEIKRQTDKEFANTLNLVRVGNILREPSTASHHDINDVCVQKDL